MKQLDFGRYSSTEWREFKRIHKAMFWADLEEKTLKEARRWLQERINEEFDIQIGALRYERSSARRDERNGKRTRTYEIRAGHIAELVIPRARKLDIRFSVFDEWERVQPMVLAALLKAYLLSRSASCAQEVTEAFGQSRFSRSFFQRLVRRFEQRLRAFHQRRIRNWPYVFVDGMAVKLKDVYLRDKVVIFAMGLDEEHNCEILDWVVAEAEDEVSVRGLLIDLKGRGLVSPELFITDDSAGIVSALRLEYPHVCWQLCAFHKTSGIQRHLVNIKLRKDILRQAGDIYALSQTRTEALRRFHEFCGRWKKEEPEAVRLFANGFENTLSYFEFPRHMWGSLYTANPLEQRIGKLRDWTARYNYFKGQGNLELAIYTYFCHKNGELVPESLPLQPERLEKTQDQIPTLFVA